MGFLTDYIRSEQKNHNPHFVMEWANGRIHCVDGPPLWPPYLQFSILVTVLNVLLLSLNLWCQYSIVPPFNFFLLSYLFILLSL